MASVSFRDVKKVYPDGTEAVRSFSLDIADGTFVVLVGPSGCGKTTLLRMVAGLEDITHGAVSIGERVVNNIDPQARDCAMVFQSYALYPHMSVYKNLAFSLKMRKMDRSEIDRRVQSTARILGLSELLDKKPGRLSGGQRQRVAMGRAIVRDPQVFLMDEPLSNLDAKLRVQMRTEISRIQRELGVTTIYVTHDQTEATTMGDVVVVLKDGVLQQVDTPKALYERPKNLFVAGFIGSPAMNLTTARLTGPSGREEVEFGGQRIRLAGNDRHRTALRPYLGRKIFVGIRPEALVDSRVAPVHGRPEVLNAEVDVREELGGEVLLHFVVASEPPELDSAQLNVDEESPLLLGRPAGTEFVARMSSHSTIREGESATLSLDPSSIYLFDPDSGDAIYSDMGGVLDSSERLSSRAGSS